MALRRRHRLRGRRGHAAIPPALNDLGELAAAALPVCIGVAVLKYRLYEIDRIISRVISYAIITAVLAGVFAGLVVLATDVLPVRTPVAVVAAFTARLRATVDLDAVQADLVAAVHDAFEPAHVSVWVTPPGLHVTPAGALPGPAPTR